MGSPEDEPKGLYGIQADGLLPSPRGVAVLFTLLVIALIIVPAVAVIGSQSTWAFAVLAAFIVIATVVWMSMGRHLVSIHVHRSDDGELWISSTSIRGHKITALMGDVERVNESPTRQSHAGLELARQWSVGLGMNRNDVAAFVERLAVDLPPGTKVKQIRHRWLFSGTKRFYDNSTSVASLT